MRKFSGTVSFFLSSAMCAVLFFSSFSFLALAQTNPQINYQAKLTDSTGLAVPDGTYNMRFWLIDSPVAATTTADWTETRTGVNRVQVTNGLFSVMLGSVSSLAGVDFNQTLYLGVEIGDTGSPVWDGEMSPRKILGTVPAAFEARRLGGVASSSFLRSDQADSASGLLTFTGGLISNSSSTIARLTTLTATTTNLVINNERFTDLTGTGLTNTSGVLSVATSTLGLSASFSNSAQLAALLSNETGTGNAVFSASPTFTGTVNAAAATLSSTLTLSGSAANIALGSNFLSGDGDDEGVLVGSTGRVDIQTTNGTVSPGLTLANTNSNTGSGNAIYFAGAGVTNSFISQEIMSSGNSDFSFTVRGSNVLSERMRLTAAGNLGIGTTSPADRLSVTGNSFLNGNLRVTGALQDASGDTGSSGQVLLSTVTGTNWTSTSTLGFSSSFSTSAGLAALLSDETGTGAAVFGTSPSFLGTIDASTATFRDTVNIYASAGVGALNVSSDLSGGEITLGDIGRINLGTGGVRLSDDGDGAITFLGLGNGSDENLTLNLDDTPNTGVFTSSTGLNQLSFSGITLAAAAGTNALPSFTFTGDPNTGIYNQAADALGLTTGGVEQVRLSSAGLDLLGTTRAILNNGQLLLQATSSSIYVNSSAAATGDTESVFIFAPGGGVTSSSSVLIGAQAGVFGGGSNSNIIGWGAGANSATGLNTSNVFGYEAGRTSSGSFNNYIGAQSGQRNNGNANDFIGYQAGRYLRSTSTVALGAQALFGSHATTYIGLNNTALGYRAGYAADDGANNNILLGYQAADNLTTGNNNIIIGYDIDNVTATADNRLNIGNLIFGTGLDGAGTTLASGNVGIGTSSPSSKLTVAGDLRVTGAFRDSSGDAGTSGQVLLSTVTGTNWVATSTLGLGGGSSFSNSAGLAALLSDETGTGNAVFSASPTFTGTLNAAAATLSSTLTMSGTAANIALGSNFLSGDGDDEGILMSSTGRVDIQTTNGSISPGLTLANTISSVGSGNSIVFNGAGMSNSSITQEIISSGNSDLFFGVRGSNVLTERMRLTAAGNLGIGTTTANQALSIFRNGADSAIEFSTISGSAEKWSMGIDDSDGAKFKISSSSVLGTNDRFVIDGGGKIGINDATPDGFFDIDAPTTFTAGTIYSAGAAGATTLTGALTGMNLNLATNFTTSHQNVTGYSVTTPSATSAQAGTFTYRGLTVTGSPVTSGVGSATTVFTGAFITNSNLTQTSGTLTANGVSVTTGTVSGTATQQGFNVIGQGITEGTLNGLNMATITGGAGTENAINIGSGWDNILNTTPFDIAGTGATTITPLTTFTAGTGISYGAGGATTLSGTYTGMDLNLSTNYIAHNRSINGYVVTLPLVNNVTGGTYTHRGLTITGSNLQQTSGAGNLTFSGAFITNSNLQPNGLSTFVANGVSVTTGSITTSGTQQGFNVIASGVGVGALNGLNISGITAGAGTETALNIGSGWDTILGTASLDITGAGAITGATGFNGLVITPDTGVVTTGTWQGIAIDPTYLDASVILSTEIDTSSELAAIVGDETGTGNLVFSASPTFTGTVNGAAATLSSTLTMSGSAANIALGSNYLSGDGGDEGISIDASGNVGIGTTTPNALFGVQRTSFATNNGVALMDQWIQTTGNTNGGTQYGTRQFLQNSNTATTTLVANLFRVQDSTTYGNTVRGLEVQTNRGGNTLGENTAISGTGRTFGIRGITEGDAGGTFEPAGGFFQTRGTTQGNAIRGYSASITSAALLSLFQDTSAFTGTGLEMNFGNTTGSFSNATSKYLDFQNAGTSVFTVTAFGTTTIGNGTDFAGLQIGRGGICVDNDGACVAGVSGRIASVSTFAGNSDLAEMYFSSQALEAGEIVSLAGELSVYRAQPDGDMPILGVVSTKPGLLLGSDDTSLRDGEEGYPIALKGRVPVKLSTENGPIRKGDELMLSSLPGVAMKATSTGTVIGIALEDFDQSRMYSETYVNQFSDDIANDSFVPIAVNTDPRINDGCYFGGGDDAGETPCVPLVSTSTAEQITEVNGIARNENKERVIQELRARGSEARSLPDGRTVTVGQVVMFVDLSERWLARDQQVSLKTMFEVAAVTNVGEIENETLFDRMKNLANNFVDGVLSIFELKANRVEVKEELCVDGVCLNADDLRRLLDESGAPLDPVNSTPPSNDGGSQTDQAPPSETLPTEPEPSPSPVPPEDPVTTEPVVEEPVVIEPEVVVEEPVIEETPEPEPAP